MCRQQLNSHLPFIHVETFIYGLDVNIAPALYEAEAIAIHLVVHLICCEELCTFTSPISFILSESNRDLPRTEEKTSGARQDELSANNVPGMI